jgi:hypothetical protein
MKGKSARNMEQVIMKTPNIAKKQIKVKEVVWQRYQG